MLSKYDALSEVELEVIRAEVTRQEFDVNDQRQKFVGIVVVMLCLIQISTMWTKFIINAAFYYDGKHKDDPKYDI